MRICMQAKRSMSVETTKKTYPGFLKLADYTIANQTSMISAKPMKTFF